MDYSRVKSYLELTSTVAVILVACVVLGSYAWKYFAPAPNVVLRNGLRKGDTFTLLPRVNYSNSPQTLVIALNSRCDHCGDGVPFYNQLKESQSENNSLTQVVAIFPNREAEVQEYLKQKQLNVNAIPGVNFEELNLTATPTIILVDRSGKISDFWIGKPSKEVEQQILGFVTHSNAS